MNIVIKSKNDLNQIESACNKAVEETAITVMNKLHDCIDEQYYKDPGFYPNLYQRTNEFFNHVTYDMLASNKAQIYVDVEGMHYKNNFSPWQVVKWRRSQNMEQIIIRQIQKAFGLFLLTGVIKI